MGLFDFLQKKKKQQEPVPTIKIGSWVTQYSAGYWQVVKTFPKYADEDYSSEGASWKKGDRLGEWVILKKGFTNKMKPSNACDFVDSQWCKPVSDDITEAIEAEFRNNPKAKQKFDSAPDMPNPSVANLWLKLSDEQALSLSELLSALPERFTKNEFLGYVKGYKECTVDPSEATHIVYIMSYLWEINEAFEPLNFKAEIKKL